MACGKVVAEHNQAELSKLEVQTANSIYTGASGKVIGTTQLKVRVGNPAASCLDESSDKALNADHDNQAELRDLTVSITSLSR